MHMVKMGMPHPGQLLIRNSGNQNDKALASQDERYNHVKQQNYGLSTRERHFRQCLAMAQCADLPYLPDTNLFLPPPWLLSAKQSEAHDGGWMALLDPMLQSTYNTRLVKAHQAMTDPKLRQ